MINRWNDADALEYLSRYNDSHGLLGDDVLRQAYATTLLGADNDLTMHGGGNTSIKKVITDSAGTAKRALYVKASGTPLCAFTPDHFIVMDLRALEDLRSLDGLDDDAMAREFKRRQLSDTEKLPSIESLMHAFVPAKIVSHTHPAAILKIVNRIGGRELSRECFGDDPAVIPYARMGFDLAKAVSEAALENTGRKCAVMRHHGLIAWGDDPREVYDRTIGIITKAEDFLARIFTRPITPPDAIPSADASIKNYAMIEPVIKDAVCQARREAGTSRNIGVAVTHGEKISTALLNTPDVIELINSPDGNSIVCSPPMTPDYPMYTPIRPAWIGGDIAADPEAALAGIDLVSVNVIIHPKIGAVCLGENEAKARMIADFTRQALSIRRAIFETGGVYENLAEEFILDMQYRGYQKSTNKK